MSAASEAEPTGADALRSDIEQTRAELAHTVDELSAKLDVKGRATDKAAQLSEQVAPYRAKIIAAAVAGVVVYVIVRRRSGRKA